MSYVLLRQPSDCVHLINDCVMLFSENKYDDDDGWLRMKTEFRLPVTTSVLTGLDVEQLYCFDQALYKTRHRTVMASDVNECITHVCNL